MNEELLEIVDEHNKLLGLQKARSIVHGELIDWHRVTVIWIVNDRSEILCQRRSVEKDADPGKWQSFFGGHVTAGQSYESNAVEELREELGLRVERKDLKPVIVRRNARVRHFAQVYILRWSGHLEDLRPDPREVAGVEWLTLLKLCDAMEGGAFCNDLDEKVVNHLENKAGSRLRGERRRYASCRGASIPASRKLDAAHRESDAGAAGRARASR
jgi:isopentenyldiphosphate isomerase